MRTMNQVTLIGRVGRDPEIRAAANGGTPWGVLSVATNRSKRDGDAWIEETDWHQVKVFGREAEYAGKYLRKGALVAVEGGIQYERWTGADGVKHYATRIVGERVSMLGAARSPADRAGEETAVPEALIEVVAEA